MTDPNQLSAHRFGRREALRFGGLTVSLAAIVAACGSDRGGDSSPGRVGYAAPRTDPPDYAVDDAALLRTASSLELTIVEVYQTAIAAGAIDADGTTLLKRLIEDHQQVADQMGELTVAAGGTAWTCTNPWMMERLVEPMLATIADSDDPARDYLNSAVALEDLGAATHQTFCTELDAADARQATLAAATLESRHSAAMAILIGGADAYISPTLEGLDVPTDDDGVPLQHAVTSRFGSVGQIELVVGIGDENGTRAKYLLQTPAENSYIYNELEPSC